MEVLDAAGLAERLRWEDKEYCLHLEAETPLEKYPGKHGIPKFARCANVAQLSSTRGECKRNWTSPKA